MFNLARGIISPSWLSRISLFVRSSLYYRRELVGLFVFYYVFLAAAVDIIYYIVLVNGLRGDDSILSEYILITRNVFGSYAFPQSYTNVMVIHSYTTTIRV